MRTTKTEELSRREREIALAYADGASYRDIGARLFIAPATVRTHIGAIYRKLGVSSKIALLHALNPPPAMQPSTAPETARPKQHASLAIMPFRARSSAPDEIADGLVQDIITRLAKLRTVRVTARGSVFALAERGASDDEAARLLGVDYIATGLVRRTGAGIAIAVELVEMQETRIVWADSYACDAAEVFLALDAIGDRIVAALASEIEASERNRAILKHPGSLGAWESFHRGLWHMYRFTEPENGRAQALFRQATDMDPTFARAWAGLSFTHFQNAFLLRPSARTDEAALAFEAARRALAADERDPTAHWAMGRALWLRGAGDLAIAELDTSVALSPHFTLGHYALAFVNSQSGDAEAAIRAADHARVLSPFDPLLFGMLGSRAMALFRLGAFEDAAEWGVRAAERPNAHVHIRMIAALCLAAAGRLGEARDYAADICRIQPGYRADDFLEAFRFAPEASRHWRRSAELIGMG